MLRIEANPGADMQLQTHFLEMETTTNDARHLVGIQGSTLRRAVAGYQQKLALTEPRHDVIRRRVCTQPPRSFSQHIVTNMMAERGIDLTHPAQIDQHETHGPGALRSGNNLLQSLLHERAVGQ